MALGSLLNVRSLLQDREPDYPLLFCILGLMVFGWAMVYSASGLFAESKYQDQFFFLKRQISWSIIGLGFFLVSFNLPLQFWQKSSRYIYIGTLISLMLVLFIGPEIAGARRWIKFGSMSIQPSELAKLSMILVVGDYLDRHQSRLREFKTGLAPLLVLVGTLLFFIFLEPDLGTPVLMGSVFISMLILGGARFKHLFIMGLVTLPIVGLAVFQVRYRLERLFAYLDPWADPYGTGYQLVQSLLALGSGGIFGQGLGNSKIKIAHLPDAHTDFVFSVLGEELGLIGSLVCVLLFLFIAIRGLKIAMKAKSCFATVVASGVSLMIGFQALINMGVSSGLFPTKGMPLPFLSFGGSSLVVTMVGIGILAHISKDSKETENQ